MKKAFSLIELLISLMIISVIAASFAPIIAKKINNGKIGVSANKVKTDCPDDKYGINCQICDNEKCLLRFCTNKCAGNQYNDSNCACQNCTDKFGSKCKTCTENTCTSSYCTNTCQGDQYRNDSCECKNCTDFGSKCKTCTQNGCVTSYCTNSCGGSQYRDGECNCKNCSEKFGEKCLACNETECLKEVNDPNCPSNCSQCDESGNCINCIDESFGLKNGRCFLYNTPKSQEDCDRVTNYTSIYIPDDLTKPDEGGFCMHRRNAGDSEGPSVASPYIITVLTGTDVKKSCKNDKCCYLGGEGRFDVDQLRTATDSCTTRDAADNAGFVPGAGVADYGACYRMVCNWDAASYICERYSVGATERGDWGLPNVKQLNSLKNAIEKGPSSATVFNYTIAIQKFSGSNGLQLCQHGQNRDKAGSPRCDTRVGYCPYESEKLDCKPSYLWGTSGDTTVCPNVCDKKNVCKPVCAPMQCVEWKQSCKCVDRYSGRVRIYSCSSDEKICESSNHYKYYDTTCAKWGQLAKPTVSFLRMGYNTTSKNGEIVVEDEYDAATAQKSTASVRCVLNRFIE